jgi:Ca2+-binding EF-hand superfamily protein
MLNQYAKLESRRKDIKYDQLTYNIYTTFPEFSKKQLDKYVALYKQFDEEKNNKLSKTDLHRLMTSLNTMLTDERKL